MLQKDCRLEVCIRNTIPDLVLLIVFLKVNLWSSSIPIKRMHISRENNNPLNVTMVQDFICEPHTLIRVHFMGYCNIYQTCPLWVSKMSVPSLTFFALIPVLDVFLAAFRLTAIHCFAVFSLLPSISFEWQYFDFCLSFPVSPSLWLMAPCLLLQLLLQFLNFLQTRTIYSPLHIPSSLLDFFSSGTSWLHFFYRLSVLFPSFTACSSFTSCFRSLSGVCLWISSLGTMWEYMWL